MIHPCDLCHNDKEFLLLPGDPSGKISICGECGFVVVRERRSTAEVAAAWNDIYASGHYDPNWPGVKARLYYVAEWIEQNIGWTDKDVLDIGAGKGQFLKFLFRYNPASMGAIEPAGNGRPEDVSEDIWWDNSSIETSVNQGQYDVITILWTLENTADCLAMLRFARGRLKPGGHVVVATGSRILVPFKKPLSSYLPQDKNYPHDTHCFRWSHASLLKVGLLCGLENDKFNDFHDRDEMVIAFKPCESVSDEFPRDGPEWVENHFERWLAIFP